MHKSFDSLTWDEGGVVSSAPPSDFEAKEAKATAMHDRAPRVSADVEELYLLTAGDVVLLHGQCMPSAWYEKGMVNQAARLHHITAALGSDGNSLAEGKTFYTQSYALGLLGFTETRNAPVERLRQVMQALRPENRRVTVPWQNVTSLHPTFWAEANPEDPDTVRMYDLQDRAWKHYQALPDVGCWLDSFGSSQFDWERAEGQALLNYLSRNVVVSCGTVVASLGMDLEKAYTLNEALGEFFTFRCSHYRDSQAAAVASARKARWVELAARYR